MLAEVDPSLLFVPSALPTWGLWPATAIAMAADAGASRLALLGIDLGTSAEPDEAHAPLRAVIELLASLVTATRFDCGAGGAPKRGWTPTPIRDIAGARVRAGLDRVLHAALHAAPGIEARAHEARGALAELGPIIDRAARLRSIALMGRSGSGRASTPSFERALETGMSEALGWGQDGRARILLQECLGVSFLPRFWRTGVDLSLGPALWRPLLLATHELTAQADALATAVAAERAA